MPKIAQGNDLSDNSKMCKIPRVKEFGTTLLAFISFATLPGCHQSTGDSNEISRSADESEKLHRRNTPAAPAARAIPDKRPIPRDVETYASLAESNVKAIEFQIKEQNALYVRNMSDMSLITNDVMRRISLQSCQEVKHYSDQALGRKPVPAKCEALRELLVPAAKTCNVYVDSFTNALKGKDSQRMGQALEAAKAFAGQEKAVLSEVRRIQGQYLSPEEMVAPAIAKLRKRFSEEQLHIIYGEAMHIGDSAQAVAEKRYPSPSGSASMTPEQMDAFAAKQESISEPLEAKESLRFQKRYGITQHEIDAIAVTGHENHWHYNGMPSGTSD